MPVVALAPPARQIQAWRRDNSRKRAVPLSSKGSLFVLRVDLSLSVKPPALCARIRVFGVRTVVKQGLASFVQLLLLLTRQMDASRGIAFHCGDGKGMFVEIS